MAIFINHFYFFKAQNRRIHFCKIDSKLIYQKTKKMDIYPFNIKFIHQCNKFFNGHLCDDLVIIKNGFRSDDEGRFNVSLTANFPTSQYQIET